jgi:hypothetical protein
MVGCCEHGNEPSGSIKRREFLHWLRSCQLPKKDCAACSFLDGDDLT